MAPEHHGPLPPITQGRCPDVEHQTVFAFGRETGSRDSDGRRVTTNARLTLWRTRAVGDRIAHTGPPGGSSGWHEPVPARGTGTVRDPFEGLDPGNISSSDSPIGGLHGDGRTVVSEYVGQPSARGRDEQAGFSEEVSTGSHHDHVFLSRAAKPACALRAQFSLQAREEAVLHHLRDA